MSTHPTQNEDKKQTGRQSSAPNDKKHSLTSVCFNFLINVSFTSTSEICAVCTFTTLWAGRTRNRGLVPGKCKICLSFPKHPDLLSFNMYHGFYLRLKRLRREADN